jgi:hypothetical protein
MMGNVCGPLYDNRVPFTAYAASTSNQITYEYFCLLGGLENDKCVKVMHMNGTHVYYTYHKVSSP